MLAQPARGKFVGFPTSFFVTFKVSLKGKRMSCQIQKESNSDFVKCKDEEQVAAENAEGDSDHPSIP